MAVTGMNGKGEATTLAALDAQLATLAEAATAQETVIAQAQEAVRATRRAREEAEIQSVMGTPAEVEKLRKVEHEAVTAAVAAESRLVALREAHARLLATRPEAEALALRERVFQVRRDYGPAVAELLAALAAVNAANAKVYALEEQARGLCAHDSTLRRTARLSTGATNLGMGRLAWNAFLSDGTASEYQRWKQRAKAAIAVPTDLATLLEPEPGSITPPTHADEYARVLELMYGGGPVKRPSEEQQRAARFRSSQA